MKRAFRRTETLHHAAWAAVGLTGLLFFTGPIPARAVGLSDTPLEMTYKTANPAVMVVFDDSGSMDFEFMTPEENGTFHSSAFLSQKFYLFPENPGDDHYPERYYRMDESERRLWRSRWQGYNTLYYTPHTAYVPWPAPDGSGPMAQADTTAPRSNPMNASHTLTLNGICTSVLSGGGTLMIRNAHYYLVDDRNANGLDDPSDGVYLVQFNQGDRECFRFTDANANRSLDDNELTAVSLSEIPEPIRPRLTPGEDLQNFANWYSFYRRRSLCAKGAMARTISGLSDLYIGFYSINRNLVQSPVPVRLTRDDGTVLDQTPTLLNRLYGLRCAGGTPLREGLDAVGRYYHGDNPGGLSGSSFASAENGGECQRVYALALTDGYWTESGTFALPTPDADDDGYDNTLADTAMTYYRSDLRPDLADRLRPSSCDRAAYQHMVTFAVSFGIKGLLDHTVYNPCTLQDAQGNSPSWADPYCGECRTKIDDLWHAAYNTTGLFFNASDPDSLVSSLKGIFGSLDDREATSAPVSAAQERFYTRNALFQGFYQSEHWIGDLRAYPIVHDETTGTVTIVPTPRWSAASMLNEQSWNARSIITFDGQTGIPFRWDSLSDGQKTALNNTPDLLDYLRGRDVEGFRQRRSLMGDIVHAGPLPVDGLVYIGANDGMLHALDQTSGRERFAYVPHGVYDSLSRLGDLRYEHRFFVDQTPSCGDVMDGSIRRTLLVGGLGRGGRSYYGLDITGMDRRTDFSESALDDIVRWEFSDEENLGYTYSAPVIIRTYATTYPDVVIVGNGYNSPSGRAQLFILDALTGTPVRVLDTEAAGDNGMATPIAVDVTNDGRADYVYAGDLLGNLWKIDIRHPDHNAWGFSYRDGNDRPAPLFTTAPGQPITSRPDVMRHCCRHGYIVCFGTGRYLDRSDLATTAPQAVYGIWDYGDDPGESLGALIPVGLGLSHHPDSDVCLLAQTIIDEHRDGDRLYRTSSRLPAQWQTVSDNLDTNPYQRDRQGLHPNPTRHVGWVLPLPAGERVSQDVAIANNVLTVLGRYPSEAPCSSGGRTTIYSLNPCSGAMIEEACVNEALQSPPAVVTTPSGDLWIYDKDTEPVTPPSDGMRPGPYFWRELP
ncbi:PilC/PilY family type IV pilus protein [Desulfatiferula olefinivorans]